MLPSNAFGRAIGKSGLSAILVTASLALATGCFGTDPTSNVNARAPSHRGLMERSVYVDGHEHKYAVFVPFDYTSAQRWPALLYLHGLSEGGIDGRKNLTVGLAKEIERRPDTFPFIAIFPQAPGGDWKGADRERLAIACLEAAQREFAIDENRVILTGLSNGGYGTWRIGAQFSSRFAALVPLCAKFAEDDIDKLTTIPIWAFHNDADPFVSSWNSREMVDRINAAGGQARLTRYDDFGHDCWTKAYADPQLTSWMLSQRRNRSTFVTVEP